MGRSFSTPITDNSSYSDYYGNPKFINKDEYDLLDDITLEILGFTVDRVKLELLGLGEDLVDPTTSEPYPDSFYEEMITLAVASTEKKFDIVIRPRLNHEKLDYNRTSFQNYMYLRLNERPIIQIDDLQLRFNNRPMYTVNDSQIKVYNRVGQVGVDPGLLGMAYGNALGVAGLPLAPNPYSTGYGYGYQSSFGYNPNFAPQMIGVTYLAGMLPADPKDRGINRDWYIQPDLVAYVSKLATIEVLERWGRLILGAGIAGYSISIDGISSSVASTQSAENTGSTADIKLLQEDMKSLSDSLSAFYGINVGILA